MSLGAHSIPTIPMAIVGHDREPPARKSSSTETESRSEKMRLLLDENRDLLSRIESGADRLQAARGETLVLRKEASQVRSMLTVQETTLAAVRDERDILAAKVARLKTEAARIRLEAHDKTLAILAVERQGYSAAKASLEARVREAEAKAAIPPRRTPRLALVLAALNLLLLGATAGLFARPVIARAKSALVQLEATASDSTNR